MVLPERRPTNPPLATSKPVIFGTPCFYARSPPPATTTTPPSTNPTWPYTLHGTWGQMASNSGYPTPSPSTCTNCGSLWGPFIYLFSFGTNLIAIRPI